MTNVERVTEVNLLACPIAVQLWSVRDLAEKDLAGVLRAISEIGYVGIEPLGLHGLKPTAFRRIADDLGLQIYSSHAPFPAGSDANRILDEQKELGVSVIAWSLERDEFATELTIARGVERVNEGIVNAARYDIQIAYHNHWVEFANTVDGRTAYQVLLDKLSPEALVELDVYWTLLAGADPAGVVRDLENRVRLLHVKDGPATGPDEAMVAVGRGAVDVPAVLHANPAVRWHIVELDRCDTDIIDALRDSYAYLVGSGLSIGRVPVAAAGSRP
jgi:sugar phosphate isomerase/epimerase